MFKRLLIVLSVVLVVAASLPTMVVAQEPVELTFVGWGGPDEQAVFQHLVDVFNENNPDIVITYQPIPTDYTTTLKTMIAGGTPPDIAYVPDGDFSAFAPRDQLVNLQPLVDASETFDPEGVWQSALGRYRWDAENKVFGQGDLYALPKDIGPTVLYINVDLFNEMGVPLPSPSEPMTWDAFIELARQLTVDTNGRHPGEVGFDVNSVETWGLGEIWFEDAVFNNGGSIISEDGRTFVMAEDQNAIDAVQFLSDLVHVHHVAPGTDQTASMSIAQMFEGGRMAMTTQGRWQTTTYRNVTDFEFDVIPFPVGPGGVSAYMGQEDCSFSGWSGSVGIGIIAGSNGEEHPEEAYRFIEFIAGTEGQTEQSALGFQIPNQIELANSDVFLQPDQYPANAELFIEAARCQPPGPWTRTPNYGEWFNYTFWNGVWPAVVLDATELAEDALYDAGPTFQEDLDAAWATIE
ncbi:MAG: sugar ABC transporter substrate-binding protein [Planctomycetaceae bacterium]|nr:MAG: sugar ABC transporter substrate-binding protein [Planctomycetaceae bacterium]